MKHKEKRAGVGVGAESVSEDEEQSNESYQAEPRPAVLYGRSHRPAMKRRFSNCFAGKEYEDAIKDSAAPAAKRRRTSKRAEEKKEDSEKKQSPRCPECQKEEVDGLSEEDPDSEWLQCDECNDWWHAHCAGLTHEEWQQYTDSDGTSWQCPICFVDADSASSSSSSLSSSSASASSTMNTE
jgi:hypothetical protein